jgi:hypothetical protein
MFFKKPLQIFDIYSILRKLLVLFNAKLLKSFLVILYMVTH